MLVGPAGTRGMRRAVVNGRPLLKNRPQRFEWRAEFSDAVYLPLDWTSVAGTTRGAQAVRATNASGDGPVDNAHPSAEVSELTSLSLSLSSCRLGWSVVESKE